MRCLPLAALFISSAAVAQPAPTSPAPQSIELRIKAQLGELMFTNTALATENEQLRYQMAGQAARITELERKLKEGASCASPSSQPCSP